MMTPAHADLIGSICANYSLSGQPESIPDTISAVLIWKDPDERLQLAGVIAEKLPPLLDLDSCQRKALLSSLNRAVRHGR